MLCSTCLCCRSLLIMPSCTCLCYRGLQNVLCSTCLCCRGLQIVLCSPCLCCKGLQNVLCSPCLCCRGLENVLCSPCLQGVGYVVPPAEFYSMCKGPLSSDVTWRNRSSSGGEQLEVLWDGQRHDWARFCPVRSFCLGGVHHSCPACSSCHLGGPLVP